MRHPDDGADERRRAQELTGPTSQFLAALFAPDDMVEVRAIHPESKPVQRKYVQAGNFATIADWANGLNREGYGIYFGVNPRSRAGGKAKDIKLARALFADFDGVQLPEVHNRIRSSSLPDPTIHIESGRPDGGVHVYWVLEVPISDLGRWSRMQRSIIEQLDSDPAIKDAPRLMRLPGYANTKYANSPPCRVIECEPARKYEAADFPEALEQTPADDAESRDYTDDDRRELRALLSRIPVTVADEYEPWLRVGMAVHSVDPTDRGLALWNGWSCDSGKWGPGECSKKWKTFDRIDGNRVGLTTLRELAENTGPCDTMPLEPLRWLTVADIFHSPQYRTGMEPLSIGYPEMDLFLGGGIRRGCVYVVAGRTGSAKSTLIANIGRKLALDGSSVLIFKLEEAPHELLWRIHAAAAQVPLRVLMDGKASVPGPDRDALRSAYQLLHDIPLRISDERDIGAIERVSCAHVEAGGKVMLVDQLSMITAGGLTPGFETATAVSNHLRVLARRLDVPIIVVGQVNRESAKHGQRLTCHSLRDSGQIENDAAGVVLIDKVRAPEGPPPSEPVRFLQLAVDKSRYGPRTHDDQHVELVWWPRQCRIEQADKGCANGE